MKYRLVYSRLAVRDINKLDNATKERIGEKLLFYLSDPFSFAIKIRSVELGKYRIRVGDYRIRFDIKKDLIIIYRIRHRKDIYKK